MSCAGTDATHRTVNFQRWPLAENSLGGGRGEHQKPLWGCEGGGMGHRPVAAGKRWPQPERCVWLMRLGPWRNGQSNLGRMAPLKRCSFPVRWLQMGEKTSRLSDSQQQRRRHSCLPKYTHLTSHFITPRTSGHFWQIIKEYN